VVSQRREPVTHWGSITSNTSGERDYTAALTQNVKLGKVRMKESVVPMSTARSTLRVTDNTHVKAGILFRVGMQFSPVILFTGKLTVMTT
jgi:hypothetical protein